MPQQQFKGYSEDQMKRIASKLGHTGGLDTLDGYLQGNPNAMNKYNSLNDAVTKRYAVGGDVNKYPAIIETNGPPDGYTLPPLPRYPATKREAVPEGISYNKDSTVGDISLTQSLKPRLPTDTATEVSNIRQDTNQLMDTDAGQVSTTAPAASTALAPTSTATAGSTKAANLATTSTAAPAVTTALKDTQAAQGTVSADAQVTAAQQEGTSVSTVDAAQTTATQVEGAPTRTLEGGELVNPVADAQKAAQFTEQITAAQADPSSRATVQGQLATLMTSFDEGKTPAWAAGAMRNATAQMAARGIGSSSMAGQALIQTALESSLPIATADAQTFANFEVTNLNNRQQRAMLSAQQRAEFMGQEFDQAFQSRVLNTNKISEIANMNFTAEQQIAIENAQIASTVNLANLSNRQGVVMAEAASLSQLDMANLNNRQQSQVENAKSFLDMDMTNLSNTQQTTMFKAQQRTTALMSDASEANAASQFNASSKNQTDQFFSNLSANVSQFNATQKNAQDNFNAGAMNASSKFNAEIKNQRDQFNAKNSLIINQSNAQWRRQVATADTVAVNRANEINAKALLDISNTAYNNLWQEHRDEMDWAYQIADNEAERFNVLAKATIEAEATINSAGEKADQDFWGDIFEFGAKVWEHW